MSSASSTASSLFFKLNTFGTRFPFAYLDSWPSDRLTKEELVHFIKTLVTHFSAAASSPETGPRSTALLVSPQSEKREGEAKLFSARFVIYFMRLKENKQTAQHLNGHLTSSSVCNGQITRVKTVEW